MKRKNKQDLIDQGIIEELVNEKLITAEEAKTLPSREQLCTAYRKCANNLVKRALNKVKTLEKTFKLKKRAYGNHGDLAIAASEYLIVAASLGIDAKAKNFDYDNTLRILITHRRGAHRQYPAGQRNFSAHRMHATYPYKDIFKYLHKRMRAPLPAPAQ